MAPVVQLSGHSAATGSASAALTVGRVVDATLISLVVVGLAPAIIIGALGFILPPLATLGIGLGVALIVMPVGARLGAYVYRVSSSPAEGPERPAPVPRAGVQARQVTARQREGSRLTAHLRPLV
jgi:hypothetical protein